MARADVASEAREALQRGDRVFMCRIIEPHTAAALAAPLPTITEQVAAVEDTGWRLEHMSSPEGGASGRTGVAVVCLFRRETSAERR